MARAGVSASDSSGAGKSSYLSGYSREEFLTLLGATASAAMRAGVFESYAPEAIVLQTMRMLHVANQVAEVVAEDRSLLVRDFDEAVSELRATVRAMNQMGGQGSVFQEDKLTLADIT